MTTPTNVCPILHGLVTRSRVDIGAIHLVGTIDDNLEGRLMRLFRLSDVLIAALHKRAADVIIAATQDLIAYRTTMGFMAAEELNSALKQAFDDMSVLWTKWIDTDLYDSDFIEFGYTLGRIARLCVDHGALTEATLQSYVQAVVAAEINSVGAVN